MWRGFALWKNHGNHFKLQLRGETEYCLGHNCLPHGPIPAFSTRMLGLCDRSLDHQHRDSSLPLGWNSWEFKKHRSIFQLLKQLTDWHTRALLNYCSPMNWIPFLCQMFLHTLWCWGWSSGFQWTEFVSVAAPQSHHSHKHENDQGEDQQHGQKVAWEKQ